MSAKCLRKRSSVSTGVLCVVFLLSCHGEVGGGVVVVVVVRVGGWMGWSGTGNEIFCVVFKLRKAYEGSCPW